MTTFRHSDPAGLREAAAQRARFAAWRAQYDLVVCHPVTGGAHCVLPILGKRCARIKRWWEPCPGCLPSTIGDHGRYFRRKGGLRLFLGQPYNPLRAEDHALLGRVRAMGLDVHVGDYGDGWYNTGTFPIVISSEPIPAHGYRCEPYED